MAVTAPEELLEILRTVPDPEVPVISVVDLGVVRSVEQADDGWVNVVITPTYSGCPAMKMMEDGIRAAARTPLKYTGGEIHLTVSIGSHRVAAYQQFDVLWQGAWQAVNRAAQVGGNRTEGGPSDYISSRLPSALERLVAGGVHGKLVLAVDPSATAPQ